MATITVARVLPLGHRCLVPVFPDGNAIASSKRLKDSVVFTMFCEWSSNFRLAGDFAPVVHIRLVEAQMNILPGMSCRRYNVRIPNRLREQLPLR